MCVLMLLFIFLFFYFMCPPLLHAQSQYAAPYSRCSPLRRLTALSIATLVSFVCESTRVSVCVALNLTYESTNLLICLCLCQRL
jgi:hypothetical protein